MTLQTVTIQLPQALYRRLEHAAALTNQTMDDVLLQTIRGNVPPSLEDAPAELQDELSALTRLSDDDLWAITQSQLDAKQWRRHQRLLQKNAAGALNKNEQEELESLRAETDRRVFRKSFALAILKWRGHTLSAGA